jgi:hypothetical protein
MKWTAADREFLIALILITAAGIGAAVWWHASMTAAFGGAR